VLHDVPWIVPAVVRIPGTFVSVERAAPTPAKESRENKAEAEREIG
jgi:hypothetical protein